MASNEGCSTNVLVFSKLLVMDKDLKNKTIVELRQMAVEFGEKSYCGGYIFSFIHSKAVTSISDISPLSKAFREKLIEADYHISQLQIVRKLSDPDGTVKYLFELEDGNRIETVLLFDDDRTTLCVSTQVGCAMGCVFCATARLKFVRNLSAGEIVDQVNTIQKEKDQITNVVFMGMGEPLLNYENVLKAVRILNQSEGKGLGVRGLTISTSGIVPGIERLSNEDILPRLAISLNGPSDAVRSKLMPINKKYPMAELFKAISVYQIKTRQRVTFEYVLIKGRNDSVADAAAIVKRLGSVKCNVNLIEYNPHPGCKLKACGSMAINRFAGVLEASGIKVAIRQRKGQSIKAACGQLGTDWSDSL